VRVAAGGGASPAELAGARGDVHVGGPAEGAARQVDGPVRDGSAPDWRAPAREPRLTEKEIQVTAASYPYLSDHVIEGIPVLPVAMAVEWLVGAAPGGGPAAAPVGRRGLHGLRQGGLGDPPRRGPPPPGGVR